MPFLTLLFHRMSLTPVALIGMVFVLPNIVTAPYFYHTNTLKLFIFALLLSGLWLYSCFTKVSSTQTHKALWAASLLSLLTLATFPGGLFSNHNVYFPIELVTDMLCVAWVVLLMRHITTKTQQQGLLYWVVVGVVIVTVQVVFDYIRQHPLNGEWVLLKRPDAMFGNVNYMAGFMGVLVPVFFMLSLPHYDGRWRWSNEQSIFCIGLVMALLAMWLGQTRSALAATVAACLLSLFIYAFIGQQQTLKKIMLRIAISGVMILTLLIVVVFVFPTVGEFLLPERFYALFDISAWWSRLMPLQGGINAFLASPWLGWGLGSSYNLNFLYLPAEAYLYTTEYSYNHVHNELVEMAEEGGIVAVLTWLGVFGYIAMALIRYAKHALDPFQQLLAVGIVGSIAAFYGHGMFSVAQRMLATNLPFYLMLGLGLGLIFQNTTIPSFIDSYKQRMPWLQRLRGIWVGIWQIALLWFALLWLVFTPWLLSFYGMVNNLANNEPPAIQEAHLQKWPNPYGLDNLLNYWWTQRQLQPALDMATHIEAIISNYRHLSYRKALLYYSHGEHQQALQEAQSEQQIDKYYSPNLVLLLSLGMVLEDAELVDKQLGYLIQSVLLRSDTFDDLHGPHHAQWQLSDEVTQLQVVQAQTQVAVVMPNTWVTELTNSSDKVTRWVNVADKIILALANSAWFLPANNNQAELRALINQYILLTKQTDDLIAQDTKAYQSKYVFSRSSSLAQTNGLAVIKQYAKDKFKPEQEAILMQLDELLESDVSAKQLTQRWLVLQELVLSLRQVKELLSHHQAEKVTSSTQIK